MMQLSGPWSTNLFVVTISDYEDYPFYFIAYPKKQDILDHFLCNYLGVSDLVHNTVWIPKEHTCNEDRIYFGDGDRKFISIRKEQLTFNI